MPMLPKNQKSIPVVNKDTTGLGEWKGHPLCKEGFIKPCKLL